MLIALLAAAAVANAPLRTKPLATTHKPAAAAPVHNKAKPAAKTQPKPKPAAPAAPPPFDAADPLAFAKLGMSQCYGPNVANKTCASLVSFRDNGDGTLSNISTVLISHDPVAVLKTITPVSVTDGAMCGQITADDIAAGTLTVEGNLLASDAAAPYLAKISAGMTPLYGHQICTSYSDNGKDLTAHIAFDGVARPEQDGEVLWVSDKDGYTVAP